MDPLKHITAFLDPKGGIVAFTPAVAPLIGQQNADTHIMIKLHHQAKIRVDATVIAMNQQNRGSGILGRHPGGVQAQSILTLGIYILGVVCGKPLVALFYMRIKTSVGSAGDLCFVQSIDLVMMAAGSKKQVAAYTKTDTNQNSQDDKCDGH